MTLQRLRASTPDILVHSAAGFLRKRGAGDHRRRIGTASSRSTSAPSSCSRPSSRDGGGAEGGDLVAIADAAALELWPGYLAHSVAKAGAGRTRHGLAKALAPRVPRQRGDARTGAAPGGHAGGGAGGDGQPDSAAPTRPARARGPGGALPPDLRLRDRLDRRDYRRIHPLAGERPPRPTPTPQSPSETECGRAENPMAIRAPRVYRLPASHLYRRPGVERRGEPAPLRQVRRVSQATDTTTG